MNFVKFLLNQHFLIFCSSISRELLLRLLWNILFSERTWWRLSDGHKQLALIDLDFLLRSAQISKKCTILGNLRTITQESKKETRQMTPFFWSTFWALMRFLMTWWKLACYENDLFTKYFRNPWKKVTKRKRKIYWGSSLEPPFSGYPPLSEA